jgi:hypothetical protein
MFQRGQKILILESSASRRAHPAVGDVGYLNNMYLFFRDRFILLDMFVLAHKSDIKVNKDRCERRRFLVDLGIDKKLKYKLSQIGIPKKFFMQNSYIANLTPAGYIFDPHGYRETPSGHSIWARQHNKKFKSILDVRVKIPYGQIAVVPNPKKPFEEASVNAIKCWMKCLTPLLIAGVKEFGYNDRDNVRTISAMASYLYYNTFGKILQNKMNVPDRTLPDVISDLRKIQVLSGFFLNSCDENLLKNPELRKYRGIINMVWGAKGSIDALVNGHGIPEEIINALVGIFFRSLLANENTKSQLFKMKNANLLPWSGASINAKSKTLEKIKLKANSGSAALNRIFEEKLF